MNLNDRNPNDSEGMNTCKKCKHWAEAKVDDNQKPLVGKRFGVCGMGVGGVSHYPDLDGCIGDGRPEDGTGKGRTGPDFGCVHWTMNLKDKITEARNSSSEHKMPTRTTMNPNDPKGAAGALKTPLSLIPPFAMEQTAWVHKLGAEKYGPFNWRETGVCASTYVNAIMRHLNAWRDGETLDPESGISHLAHVACSCNILLDADHCGTLQDDRNVKPQNINYYAKPDDSTKKGDKFYSSDLGLWPDDSTKKGDKFYSSDLGLWFTNPIIGSEHRRIDDGEPFIEGDELYCNYDDSWIPVLYPSGKICCWKDLARRKIDPPDAEYYYLKPDDLIQEGDQVYNEFLGWWSPTAHRAKDKLNAGGSIFKYRRKIESTEPESCNCGRIKVNHYTMGLICEDCELKWQDPY